MRKLLVALVATFLMVPVAVVFGPSALGLTIGNATFNTPRPYAKDPGNFAIINRVERAIERTPGTPGLNVPPRHAIHITSFLLDRTSTVTELIQACRRGVAVRVILDPDIQNRNSRRLIAALNGDNLDGANHAAERGRCNRDLRSSRTGATVEEQNATMTSKQLVNSVDARLEGAAEWGGDGSYVKRCRAGCRTGRGNMHMKIFLFTRAEGARNVVMVSSSNLNRGGAKLGWNDMYVMKGKERSYDAYVRWHREMTAEERPPGQMREIIQGPFTTRFFPVAGGINVDPVMADLRTIRCGSDLGRTRIHVSMFYWKGTRGNYIASKLLDLARNGCAVKIIYGAPSVQIAERLRDAARRGLIRLYDSRWDYNDDGWNEVRTHCKYVLVRGTYRGDRSTRVVMTGSPNWVAGSLSKGDESTLNIELGSAYNAYLRSWETIRNHSRRIPRR